MIKNGMLDISNLVPEDVVKNSGTEIPLYGEITGSKNEIIVITQLKRTVYEAYVCNWELGKDKLYKILSPCVTDLPGFNSLVINPMSAVRSVNNTICTMACLAEKDYEQSRSNWLN